MFTYRFKCKYDYTTEFCVIFCCKTPISTRFEPYCLKHTIAYTNNAFTDTLATSADVTQTTRKIKYIRVFYFTFDTLIQFVSLYPTLGIGEEKFCPYNCYFEFKISFLIYEGHPRKGVLS